jgi:hypothetical protein
MIEKTDLKIQDIKSFLEDREQWRIMVANTAPTDESVVVMDPGDEIICDRCNELINHEEADLLTKIYTTDWGAYCKPCWETR